MEKPSSRLDSSRDVTLAAYGLEHKVNDTTIFCTPDPLAASSVVRDLNRMQLPSGATSRGSFLEDMSRLSMRSMSAMDLTHQLKQLNFTLSSDVSRHENVLATQDSGPDLIQFSGNTDIDQETNKSDTSSRSSMGLIPSDMLNDCDLLKCLSGTDLSDSILPMSNPKVDPKLDPLPPRERQDTSHSTLREKSADSKDWSDNSQSKQDSKDMPWGRSQLETVKKRPQDPENRREGEPPKGIAPRGTVALFAGHLLDNVAEGDELEQSVHNIELGEDDLKQLDAGVDFSDLEEDHLSGRESGDEDFDFDEPMLSLPTRGRVSEQEEDAGRDGDRTLQAELFEVQYRLGEGQESEDVGSASARVPLAGSAKDTGLDLRYFRQTPMSFAGDGVDSNCHGNLTTNSHHRGAAEGEHSLTKQRRQFMTGDGSEKEMDKDDDIKQAKKSTSLSTRERGQGADEEDSDRSNLPLPVGLENAASGHQGNRGNEVSASQFSFLTRQRAEGDADSSPLPWGGGDGSSGDDSDGEGGKVSARSTRPSFRYVSGAAMASDHQPVSTDQSSLSRILSDSHTGEDTGLQPEFFLPTSIASVSVLHDSEVISPQTLEGSTFRVEDLWKSTADVLPAVAHSIPGEAPKVDASGLGAQDRPENPFEDQLARSFWSFGLGPEEEDPETEAAGRSVENGRGQTQLPREAVQQGPSPKAEALAKPVAGTHPKGSGSFDGPFRKPRAPAPPKKKAERNETYELDSNDSWKKTTLADVLGESTNLERELKELGIDVGDKDFRSTEGAQAVMQAEGQQFEEKDKFSEHHQLALAAEGLVWDGEESGFSGYLGGDFSGYLGGEEVPPEHMDTSIGTYMAARTLGVDPKTSKLPLSAEGLVWDTEESGCSGYLGGEFSGYLGGEEVPPEHMETSIGTYMAARTETLGTLGVDPKIPRPEFGRPVRSPPHCSFPLKLMSPPSTASSLLSSRIEGEGNEEADKTMVSGDCTLEASTLSASSSKSPGPALPHKEFSSASPDDKAAAGGAAEEMTLREELSSILHDLTHEGGGDVTIEEALSNSAVLDFLKNHSYSDAADFVSAIMKLTTTKKQSMALQSKGAAQKSSMTAVDSGKSNKKQAAQEKSVTGGTDPGKESRKQGTRNEKQETLENSKTDSKDAGKQSQKQEGSAPSSSSKQTSSIFTSTQIPRSKLPVRIGSATSPPAENKPGRMKTKENSRAERSNSMVQDSVPARRSQSGQRHSVNSVCNDVNRQNEDMSTRDVSSNKQSADTNKKDISNKGDDKSQKSAATSNMNKRGVDVAKVDTSKQRAEQNSNRAVASDVLQSVPGIDSGRSKQLPSIESLPTNVQPQGPTKTDPISKKPAYQVHFEQDQVGGAGSVKLSTDLTAKLKTSPERESSSRKKEHHSAESKQDSGNKINTCSANPGSINHDILPLNIPANLSQERGSEKEREQPTTQKNHNSTKPAVFEKREKWKDTESFHQLAVLQTPPQRLASSTQPPVSVDTSLQQESFRNEEPGSGSPIHMFPADPSSLPIQSLGSMAQSRPLSQSEPRSLEVVPKANDLTASLRDAAAQRPGSSLPPHAFPPSSSSTDVHRQPTLLTGNSLLKTEFAQKYLTPADARRQGVVPPSSSSQYYSSGIHVQPDHLPPKNAGGFVSVSHPTPSSSLPTPSIYFPSSSQSAQVYGGGRSRPMTNSMALGVMPSESKTGVDESAMSVYYELNEDLEHSTMLQGVEGSALGSFWGKSPLYQSTPALELGKVAAISMMGSRLDERELTTPGKDMVTPRVQRQLIQIQRAVDFQEFCCLGVSQKTSLPVTNSTVYSVTCRFRLVRLLHNGNPIKLDHQSPFELKPKISIGAGATENVPVLFVPKRPGEHVCQIEVYTQSLNPTLEPTISVVQLRAFAEVPQLQISPSVEVLDMGEVIWGGCVTRTIKLRNVKRASLPVRLSIWSGTSVWHCFTFDNSSCGGGGDSSDLSIISMASRPESVGRNVVTVILPGCDSPSMAKTLEFALHCRAPRKELTRTLAERAAEHIDAKIDIEVDTPVKCLPPLSSIQLRATVGMPRLLIPTSHMSVTFRTRPQRSMQENVTINNAGNITLNLTLSVAAFQECFTLSQTHLAIKPGSQEQVAVVFSPQGGEVYHYQSLLQLDVEPEGPSYEIPLEGQVAAVDSTQKAGGGSLNILTSKSFLAFHGVSLNQTKSLAVKLYNKDHNNAEHACVEVRQSTDCFKLVSASGEWQQKCDVVIEPRETITLTVIFCPTAVQGYSAKLIIRKPNFHSSKYSIRMVGYGGRSVLTLSGACLTNSGQRWLELGSLAVSHNIMREIVLTNTGVRAAFVRGSAFYDMPCRQPVFSGRVAVEPNNFVLAPGCSMKVMVAMSPSQREVDLVRTRKEVVAVVQFQHGDEVMRQKYQRSCIRDGGGDTHAWQALFRQPFANEAQDSVVLEGSSIADSPNDSSAFFHHIESVCVALLAQPSPGHSIPANSSALTSQPYTHTPTPQGDSSSVSSSSLPTHDRTYPHVREDNRQLDSTGQFVVPSRPDNEEDWSVKPDFLSLTVGENNQKMLQLINFSKQTLSFELSWPPSSVVPEPKKGEIKPRSRLSVEVWLHMSWQQRLSELPWRGAITITCNGQEKSVRVTVQKPAQSPLHPVASPASISQRSPHTTTMMSLMSDTTTAGHSLKLATTNIHFTKARVNATQESMLELTNASLEPVQLKLSPFAPAYVKGSDESNTVKRAGFSVFTFPTTTADLLPQETIKLPVRFCPQTKGTFNQHWEIEYWPLSSKRTAHDKKSTRISMTAEVSAEASSKKLTWETVEQDKTIASSSRTPLQEKHPNTVDICGVDRGAASSCVPELQLLQSEVVFSRTTCGQVTQVKVEFKNSLDHNVELQVEAPSPPFRIKHKAFKITRKRILKYPIEFSPSTAGSFADSLVFRAPELGKSFTVRLKGTAA